jgi:pilus assembly protein CpaF
MTLPDTAFDQIRARVLREVELRQLDVSAGSAEIISCVRDAVGDYQLAAEAGAEAGAVLANPEEVAKRLLRSITDLGPLAGILSEPGVEEIFIEGDRVTYIDGKGVLRSPGEVTSVDEMWRMLARLLAATDRHLDTASPVVQARVLDGSARLTAVIPPVSDRPSATIRRYALRRETLSFLVEMGSLSTAAAGLLRAASQATTSVVVSGPPGAGKTSLLAALLAAVPADHCVRCVEEVRELQVPLSPHSSYYEARPGGLDGGGEVSVRALVKLVLAMRPDRIVVGEVRGAEAFELTRAANAGCGFACTVHANSAPDALAALVSAAMMAGENVVEPVVGKIFAGSIDLVVHLARDFGGSGGGSIRRKVMDISAVSAGADGFVLQPLFLRRDLGAELAWTGPSLDGELWSRLQAAVAPANLESICSGVDA